jgi:choline dehydrogenase-like flavoprotein
MTYVIGSGPAGVSCAKALLARGVAVTMLDAGVQMAPEIRKKLTEVQTVWDAKLVNYFKSTLSSEDSIKLAYGSNYPYAEVENHLSFVSAPEVYCKPSFAQGGLSNVWGAFITPYLSEEIADWPLTIDSLVPYYRKVLEFLPLAQSQYEQVNKYPLYCESTNFYSSSQQATYLYQYLEGNRVGIAQLGGSYGYARLAVRFSKSNLPYCVYCGMCQYGCPLELIYSAQETLVELRKNPNFSYIPGVVVEQLSEEDGIVQINGYELENKKTMIFEAKQVFLACGAILSTIIMARSLKLYGQKITLKDSQHFMFPAFLYKRFKNVQKEKLHTLCQLFIAVDNKDVSKHPINLQIYTYMEQFENEFKKIFGVFYPLFKLLLRPILERLIVIQGYLHSADSPAYGITINQDDKNVAISYVGTQTEQTVIKRVLSFLSLKRKDFGFIPISFMLKISKVGRSYHYGSSFPMQEHPTGFSTDLLGRVPNFKWVHIVDSSAFPSIPAQSITLSVMANAYRIAHECEINVS